MHRKLLGQFPSQQGEKTLASSISEKRFQRSPFLSVIEALGGLATFLLNAEEEHYEKAPSAEFIGQHNLNYERSNQYYQELERLPSASEQLSLVFQNNTGSFMQRNSLYLKQTY